MTVQISYKKTVNEKSIKNYVLFSDENWKIYGLNSILLIKRSSSFISKLIKENSNKKDKFLKFNLNSSQKIILVKTKKTTTLDNERSGAEFYNFIKSNSILSLTLLEKNINEIQPKNKNFLDEFLQGTQLKSYEFSKYKTKKKSKTVEINISIKNKPSMLNKNNRFNSLIEGTNLTKDLVSEPGNILHPDEYAKRLVKLKKFGLKVTVYDEKKLKKLGCNALVGVGQGSIRGSYLVTMEWNGTKSK